MDTIAQSWPANSYWGTFWGQFTIEILGGLTGAFIFLFIVLWFVRPKIRIAGFLCKIPNGGIDYYHFKFVNDSFFDAHDVKIDCMRFEKFPWVTDSTTIPARS
ncbi:MAG: hypothetical protein K1X47_08410 [Cyclobacteriaceae bacterium]|nr:hypothetical protein [Cyclobacteriaceae bacterium]